MELYLVCVIEQPTAKAKHDDGAVPQIVLQPTAVMAKDETTASMKASALVPDFASKSDRLEVRVIPFRTVCR